MDFRTTFLVNTFNWPASQRRAARSRSAWSLRTDELPLDLKYEFIRFEAGNLKHSPQTASSTRPSGASRLQCRANGVTGAWQCKAKGSKLTGPGAWVASLSIVGLQAPGRSYQQPLLEESRVLCSDS